LIGNACVGSERIWGDNLKKVDEDEASEYLQKVSKYEQGDYTIGASEIYEVEHGTFWQLMPVNSDDGFFDWYCWVRENYQFFKTKEICALYFIKYWTYWVRQGKPNWEGTSKNLKI
jgi:hypothetical protein